MGCQVCQAYLIGSREFLTTSNGNSDWKGFVRIMEAHHKHWVNTHRRPVERLDPRLHTYFVTFTIDPSKGQISRDDFEALIQRQLSRSCLDDAYYVIEHVDSNMHAHCLVKSRNPLSPPAKQWYHMVRHVGYVRQDVVRRDNGIQAYMTKENGLHHRRSIGDGIFDWP